MKNNFKCSYSCNEKTLMKEYFEFYKEKNAKKSIRNFMYYIVFTMGYNQSFLNWIIKYLLHHHNINPLEIENIVRKHIVLFIYSWLKETKNYYYNNSDFNKLLSDKLTIDDIQNKKINDDHILTNIYLKTFEFKQFKKLVNDLKKDLDFLKAKEQNIIVNLLNKENYFFVENHNTELLMLKVDNARRIDQLISENIINDEFVNFNIELDELNYEKYIKNVDHSESPKSLKTRFLLFIALITMDIINTENYDLSKKVNIERLRESRLFTKDKSCTFFKKYSTKLLFMDIDGTILKDKIISFQFSLNGNRYELSSNGLNKL